MTRVRLDHRLVEMGLAPTRSKAQQLIASREVTVNGKVVEQSSFTVPVGAHVQIVDDPSTLKYVSRGGLKLEAALNHFYLNVTGWRCLDVGLSTGGFSDCLLRAGAAAIAGLDVGHGQLHESLERDPRLKSWSGLHVRDLPDHAELNEFMSAGLDLTVVDVSFISLKDVIPYLPRKGLRLALVKPQFEVGREYITKKGLVRDAKRVEDVKVSVRRWFEEDGYMVRGFVRSALVGGDGNQEWFVFGSPAKP